MDFKDARITILVNQEYTTIELYDYVSGLTIVDIKLTAEQLSQALSRLGYTKCEAKILNAEMINKNMEMDKLSFEIGEIERFKKGANKLITEKALAACPEGWIPDTSFNSQDTFFEKDGIKYARTTIRRWITSPQK